MKGSYILLIKIPNTKHITIGKLGELEFENGYYAYVGSAMNGLNGRISRHLRKNKKEFWHIDYLLKFGRIIEIHYKNSRRKMECRFAQDLALKFKAVKNFGSSDCNCQSHLFYNKDKNHIKNAIQNTGMKKYLRKGVEGDEIKKDNWG